jgi:hypothetical protein
MQTAFEHKSSGLLEPARLVFVVQHLGEGARQAWLPGIGWHVLAIFRRSFYIQNSKGGLVCFGSLSMGLGPLNALYRFPLEINWLDAGLKEDSAATFDGRALQVADRFVFDIFGAQRWRPEAVCNFDCHDALTGGLALMEAIAPCQAPQDSLAYLVQRFTENAVMKNPEPAAVTEFQRACLNGAAHLKSWLGRRLSGRVDRRPPREIKSLLGLGPGLTPSGDDLLGGSLIALHSLGLGDIAYELWGWLAPAAGQRTNVISLAHLNWAARGRGAEPIHKMIRTLFSNDTAGLPACLRALGRIGHTSGWDALAGIALVCKNYLEHQHLGCGGCGKNSGR